MMIVTIKNLKKGVESELSGMLQCLVSTSKRINYKVSLKSSYVINFYNSPFGKVLMALKSNIPNAVIYQDFRIHIALLESDKNAYGNHFKEYVFYLVEFKEIFIPQ